MKRWLSLPTNVARSSLGPRASRPPALNATMFESERVHSSLNGSAAASQVLDARCPNEIRVRR